MINGITGRPGGGKSYEAVKTHIIEAIKLKRKVVTNLPLNVDHFISVFGAYVKDLIVLVDGDFHNFGKQRPFATANDFLTYNDWRNEDNLGVMFVIDECHLCMPLGSTQKELKEYLSMHRHYGHDIILITQNFRKVDRDIRDMINNTYRCIKKSFLGNDNAYILKVHEGVSGTVVNTTERIYEPAFFKFYKSHTMTDKPVKEYSTKDLKAWYKHWTMKAALGFLVLFILMVINSVNSFNEGIDKKNAILNKNKNAQLSENAPTIQPQNNVDDKQVQIKTNKDNKELEEQKINKHPFYKVNLHIAGYADYYDGFKTKREYHIAASRNGQYLFTIGLRDLFMAGYDVHILGDCMLRLQYDEKLIDWVTCDTPTTQITGALIDDSKNKAE